LQPESAIWLPHTGAGYQPQFTFTLSSLMARTAARAAGTDGARLEARLARLTDRHTTAVVFSEVSRLPLAMSGALTLNLTDLYELGALARKLLDRLAATHPHVISVTCGLGTLLTFLRSGLCTVVISTQSSSTARLLGRFIRGDYGDL